MIQFLVAFVAVVFVNFASAETSGAVSAGTVLAPKGAIQASIEVRPSAKEGNKFFTENEANLGYQFNSKISAGYRQGFEANISNYEDNARRLNPTITDSILRARIDDIWKDTQMGTSLSYEPRLYLPLAQKLKDAGHVASVRNYVMLTQKIAAPVKVTLMEIPILHAYDRAGYTNSEGKLAANPSLENRVYLVTSVSLADNLNLDLPINLNSVRNSNFAGAGNSGRLQHRLWIYPELTYKIDPTWTVGAAYYSENMLKYNDDGKGSDYEGMDISHGLSHGIAQLLVKASL